MIDLDALEQDFADKRLLMSGPAEKAMRELIEEVRKSRDNDLLRQAVEALCGLVADDLTYDGRFIIIECVNHTDAIAKVIAARAVLSLAVKRGM